jgi:hypothetical protein
MRNYRSNTNRLANLKNNTVVRQAIQRDKDIKTTQRSTNFGYAAASLLIPGGFLTGISGKAIGQAFKNAGSLFKNTRGANTVGGSIKQTEAMIGKKRFDKTRIASQYQGTEYGTHGASLAFKAGNAKTSISKIKHDGLAKKFYGTFQQRKTDRIITNAVEQGPAKHFSKVKNNSKTGVVRNKRREKHNTASHNPEDGWQPNFGAEGGTSRGSLLKYRKDMGMVQKTIKTPSRSNIPSSAKGSLLLNKVEDNKHLLKYYSQTGREKQFDKLFDKNQSLERLLFKNKSLKSLIDATNKAARKKPKK